VQKNQPGFDNKGTCCFDISTYIDVIIFIVGLYLYSWACSFLVILTRQLFRGKLLQVGNIGAKNLFINLIAGMTTVFFGMQQVCIDQLIDMMGNS